MRVSTRKAGEMRGIGSRALRKSATVGTVGRKSGGFVMFPSDTWNMGAGRAGLKPDFNVANRRFRNCLEDLGWLVFS
jgi:hypothetical protein